MALPRMRPAFDVELPLPREEVMARLERQLNDDDCPCVGRIRSRHAWFCLRQEERRPWSPFLDVEVHERGPERSEVRCRFTPHPSLWTLVVTTYGALAFVALAALVFGLSQWTMGRAPWSLLVIPGAGLVALGIYLGALLGQRLGEPQMHVLDRMLGRTLGLGESASGARSAFEPHAEALQGGIAVRQTEEPVGSGPARTV